jgi:dihydroorotate dehydrogenase (NAD+) catalytic subunit
VALARTVAGIAFSNPVLLASGTAGYGREVAGVTALHRLGGLVTKAVSRDARGGNRPPRVAEFTGGMLNSVGLANPGASAVRQHDLPWLAAAAPSLPVIINVVGFTVAEYAEVIAVLDDFPGHVAYELNLSCPNTSAGGAEFGADPASVTAVVAQCRLATARPIFAKLSPALPNIVAIASVAVAAGADGITAVNTMPGTDFDGAEPRIGQGYGGVSGPALRPVGLLAVSRIAAALPGIPVIGVGGISTAGHVRDYLRAGAALVAIGTAALADPHLATRIITELERDDG